MTLEVFLMLLQAVVTLIVGYVGVKLKKREREKDKEREEQGAIRDGIRAVLRDRILQAYNHFSRQGKIQIEELEKGVKEKNYRDGIYDKLIVLFVILAVIYMADWMVYCYEQYQLR